MMTRSARRQRVFAVYCTALFSVFAWAPSIDADDALDTPPLQLDSAARQRCLDVLLAAVKSDEFWPSMHAAEALTLTGKGDVVRQLLTPRLPAESDDQRRCGLARELVRAGDRAQAAVLLDILAGAENHGHLHAAESLYKINEIGDGAALRRAMKQTESASLQLMAAAALARWGNRQALALVRTSLSDKRPDVARLAGWILARIGGDRDIVPLRRAAQRSEDRLVRAFLEHALAALGDAQGLQSLRRNLTDDDPAVRTYAAVFAAEAYDVTSVDLLLKLLDDAHLDARIRAAQSLLVLSQPRTASPSDDIAHDVYPAGKENPRMSEGSIVALRDGSLLFAVTQFMGGGSDFSQARIVARRSSDGGRTWKAQRVLQENVGRRNVMSATLRRLGDHADAPLALFYLVKNGYDDLDAYLRVSRDDGQTFSDPVLITDAPGYHVMNNDRVTRLTGGRLLAPVATTADVRKVNHFTSYCFLSDDNGATWRKGKGQVDAARRGAMEPEVLELNDGRVLMIVRTQLGHIAASYSDDGGDTWSAPRDWGVKAPEAPATLRRIPSTGDLLLIWNNTYTADAGHGGRRTPLTAAVSGDEGRSWQHLRDLETRDDQSYAYTSLAFVRGRAVISYYVRNEKTAAISCRFRSLPIAWFYEK